MSDVIWHKKDLKLEDIRSVFETNMLKALEIVCTEIGDDFLVLEMPVKQAHAQPFGLLHGGASCVLAESAGSIASNLTVDSKKNFTLGLEINATHLRSAKIGDEVIALCRPVRLGRTVQVWDIEISSRNQKTLLCKSRLTTMTKRRV